jgi:hypothetical protein
VPMGFLGGVVLQVGCSGAVLGVFVSLPCGLVALCSGCSSLVWAYM